MALSRQTKNALALALSSVDVANELAAELNATGTH